MGRVGAWREKSPLGRCGVQYSPRMSTNACLAVALVVLAGAVEAQPARYEFRAVHDPNGIGKFYMGREIAHVMGGHEGIKWLERPEREEEERTQLLIDALKLRPGEVVADIGAGTGYHVRRMAPKVLPAGKV